MNQQQTAFLLLSCDKYYSMIDPYAELMERFWPDCPWPKFAATNNIKYDRRGFAPILIGADVSWSSGLKVALSQLHDDGFVYVFIALEDLFLRDKVDTKKINHIASDFMALNGNYIRFYTHKKEKNKVTDDFGEIVKGEPYRQNCVYAMWKINTLMDILDEKENAWEFEKIAVERGCKYDKFYSVNKSQFKILNTLIKGRWVPYDLRCARKMLPNLVIDRPVMSRFDEFKLNAGRLRHYIIFHIIPVSYRKYMVRKYK